MSTPPRKPSGGSGRSGSASKKQTTAGDSRRDRTGRAAGGAPRRDGQPPGREAGGPAHEAELSPQARDRLRRLRSEYDAADDERDRITQHDRDDYADVPDGIRLQKVLAQAGVASRRASEELIHQGRVEVDGQIVRRFGARVDPATSVIRVDGMRIATAPDLLYYALNKPRGVVSTMSDPQGRPTLADYSTESDERLFHVGRLDVDTEGLLLLTNDGELANRLTHPRYKVPKTYVAVVPGPVDRQLGRRLRRGVELEDGLVEVDDFSVVDATGNRAMVQVTLHEGRKHIVRRLLEEVGHPVKELVRTEIGPVRLGKLKPGTMRQLSAQEISELFDAVGM
ncbi:pseudouridine synthase [Allonocardiopsis opalescens]|uniref:Pseudouridine synthase n=1 Tax=Allonocardiopsis opalescens TaxID=1144618 RepID=A0A2T0Q4K7_9ACTN|nr:pseudouridine synthase [Allonocardiopsis opalescens]PRX98651.1 23S rRNA pseudouridine2605 synthase/16S rRNA pseudouridine516 synthase [Allonocardiopsis opalescens]